MFALLVMYQYCIVRFSLPTSLRCHSVCPVSRTAAAVGRRSFWQFSSSVTDTCPTSPTAQRLPDRQKTRQTVVLTGERIAVIQAIAVFLVSNMIARLGDSNDKLFHNSSSSNSCTPPAIHRTETVPGMIHRAAAACLPPTIYL